MEALRRMFFEQRYDVARKLIGELSNCELAGVNNTILHIAADVVDTGCTMLIALELGYGYLIDTPARHYKNETPVHVAIRRGNVQGFMYMVPHLNRLSQKTLGECLVLAAEFNQRDIIRHLTAHVQPTHPAAECAVETAVKHRCPGAFAALVCAYTEIAAASFSSLLEEILRAKKCRGELLGVMRQLAQVRPHALHTKTAKRGRTPLHVTAAYRNVDSVGFVRFLTDSGASLSALDAEGMTPLQRAYSNNNQLCLRAMLVVPGCPVEWKPNSKGPTLFSRIATGNDPYLLDLMLVGNPQYKEDHNLVRTMIAAKNIEMLRHVVAKYPSVAAARGFFGRNLLMLTIFEKLSCTDIEMILRQGVFDIDAQDDMGHTALHYAAVRGDLAVIECVLRRERRSSLTRNIMGVLPVETGSTVNPPVLFRLFVANRQLIDMVSSRTLEILRFHFPERMKRYLVHSPSMLHLLIEAEKEVDMIAPARH